jgi:hypothetical protein
VLAGWRELLQLQLQLCNKVRPGLHAGTLQDCSTLPHGQWLCVPQTPVLACRCSRTCGGACCRATRRAC